MAKQKQKKEAYINISYRAVRDFHTLVFLIGSSWILYETRPFYWYYNLPAYIVVFMLSLWVIALAGHFWFVNRIHELRAERDTLQEELDERKQADSVLVRLRDDGEWQEMADYEEEKPKHNHHS